MSLTPTNRSSAHARNFHRSLSFPCHTHELVSKWQPRDHEPASETSIPFRKVLLELQLLDASRGLRDFRGDRGVLLVLVLVGQLAQLKCQLNAETRHKSTSKACLVQLGPQHLLLCARFHAFALLKLGLFSKHALLDVQDLLAQRV